MHGRHKCTKDKKDPTFDKKWSGVSYAPHCDYECRCKDCNEQLHLEGHDSHYCPRCDDFKPKKKECKNG